jgi:hypothetical protein
MADIDAIIKLRRGSNFDRLPIKFAEGEIVFTTDTKRVFIGDNTTNGGIFVGNQNYWGPWTLDFHNGPNVFGNFNAIKGDLWYNTSTNIMYLLSNNNGPDLVANYMRVSPIADEKTIFYRDGVFSFNMALLDGGGGGGDPLDPDAVKFGYVHLSGDVMSGPNWLTLKGDPELPLHAATKRYVDTRTSSLCTFITNTDNGFVPLSGGTMKGPQHLTLHAHPTASFHATTKFYVDNQLSTNLLNYIKRPPLDAGGNSPSDGNVLTYRIAQNAGESSGWRSEPPNSIFFTTPVINTLPTDAARTLLPTDAGSIILVNYNGGGVFEISIPPASNTNIPIGSQIIVIQRGSSRVYFKPYANLTSVQISSQSNRRYTLGQNAGAVLIKIAENEWFLGGDIVI